LFFDLLPTLYGLIAAGTWGAGDFSGGIAAKRTNAYNVVIFAHLASILILILLVFILHEPIPPFRDLVWGGAAGLGGGFGLMLLYKALATGKMAVVAPVSALIAAAVPVIFIWVTAGFPGYLVTLGFLLAMAAIWLLSAPDTKEFSLTSLKLPATAGFAFGFFFLCLHQASSSEILYPLIAVRVVSISSLAFYISVTHQPIRPAYSSWIPILLSGLFDTVGNGAFALASQLGRVDSASVISSLYPGSTVILAYLFLKEKITRKQFFGICLALLALGFITTKF